jgi:uncharacterized protein (TIGR00369 family)
MRPTAVGANGTPPPTEWGEPRSRSVTWYDPQVTATVGRNLSGLDFLGAIRDGRLPPPPIASSLGFSLVEVEEGLAVFECQSDESAYNPIGVVHGGLVCTLADSAAGCAVQSTLGPGQGFTSIDIAVSYLRPVTQDSGVLRAVGRITKRGRRVAFASVEVLDGTTAVVATATSSCLVIDPVAH